jgi:hypothetical protein
VDPYTSGTSVGMLIQDGPLGNGHYRFTAKSTLLDRSGNPLDGNGDGTGGDAYTQVFDVALPAGLVFEGRNNDTQATATPLTLTEDPAGSGLLVGGRGIGSIDPLTDQDYWSFSALAGDIASISVDPTSGLFPVVELHDAAGNGLASDGGYWGGGGPNGGAFISHYVIPTSGTYYARVCDSSYYSQRLPVGSYQMHVELARGIQQESDSGYSNGSIAGANAINLATVGTHRTGTMA